MVLTVRIVRLLIIVLVHISFTARERPTFLSIIYAISTQGSLSLCMHNRFSSFNGCTWFIISNVPFMSYYYFNDDSLQQLYILLLIVPKLDLIIDHVKNNEQPSPNIKKYKQGIVCTFQMIVSVRDFCWKCNIHETSNCTENLHIIENVLWKVYYKTSIKKFLDEILQRNN